MKLSMSGTGYDLYVLTFTLNNMEYLYGICEAGIMLQGWISHYDL